MYRRVETFPPAKLNLFLEVLGKRNDGFHELDTVMMAVDLRDAMRVERTEEAGISLDCAWQPSLENWRWRLGVARREAANNAGRQASDQSDGLEQLRLPAAEQNLVYRGLERFKQVFRQACGFRVRLAKHIPSGAGMGGASSDAASVLRCAASLCGISLHDPRLIEIAAELGSDIPFFMGLSVDGSTRWARARGRGEKLQGFDAAGLHHFVIVYPPEGLSTAAVYKHCSWDASPRSADQLLSALSDRPSVNRIVPLLFNRLTEPARRLSAWIDRTLQSLNSVGLQGAAMTGSGSACFALAPSATVARRAVNRLSGAGVGACFATNSVRLPTPIRFLT